MICRWKTKQIYHIDWAYFLSCSLVNVSKCTKYVNLSFCSIVKVFRFSLFFLHSIFMICRWKTKQIYHIDWAYFLSCNLVNVSKCTKYVNLSFCSIVKVFRFSLFFLHSIFMICRWKTKQIYHIDRAYFLSCNLVNVSKCTKYVNLSFCSIVKVFRFSLFFMYTIFVIWTWKLSKFNITRLLKIILYYLLVNISKCTKYVKCSFYVLKVLTFLSTFNLHIIELKIFWQIHVQEFPPKFMTILWHSNFWQFCSIWLMANKRHMPP